MGALGVGAVKDSVIGSNTERVLRRVRNSDMLIIKQPTPVGTGKIVVAVDGSPYSFGGLMTGLALGKAFNVPVEAISAFDPYFHYAAFPQHFRRPQRRGRQGLPLQGTGEAARRSHRQRSGKDLSVAPGYLPRDRPKPSRPM
jgi:hypothetical protein